METLLGERLKEVREKCEVSQEEAAAFGYAYPGYHFDRNLLH